MQFNEQVIALRNRMGRSQKDFGILMGVSATTVVDWEKGRHKPNMEKQKAIQQICERLGIV